MSFDMIFPVLIMTALVVGYAISSAWLHARTGGASKVPLRWVVVAIVLAAAVNFYLKVNWSLDGWWEGARTIGVYLLFLVLGEIIHARRSPLAAKALTGELGFDIFRRRYAQDDDGNETDVIEDEGDYGVHFRGEDFQSVEGRPGVFRAAVDFPDVQANVDVHVTPEGSVVVLYDGNAIVPEVNTLKPVRG